MAAFKFNLQQLDLTGAYDRYLKELEEQKKQEIYDNKLVEQEIDDYNKYYSTKNMRDQEVPLLKSSFDEFKNASNVYNKAIRRGDVDAANAASEKRRKATVDMGDIYKNSAIAKNTVGQLSNVKKKEINGELVVDDEDFNEKLKLFNSGSLEDIKKLYGSSDTWGDVANTVSLTNNKYNERFAKAINVFNPVSVAVSKNQNFIKNKTPISYESVKLDNGDEVKYPVYEYLPDMQKAQVIAANLPSSFGRKAMNDFNASIAQGGVNGDIAKQMLQKVLTASNKTSVDQLTPIDLLAYQIAGDARKETDLKQGKATWEMNMDNKKQDFNEKMAGLRLQLARAKAASQSSKEKEITSKQLALAIGYYKESRADWITLGEGKMNITKGAEPKLQNWIDLNPGIINFINKNSPKTKGNLAETFKALEGYLKTAPSTLARELADGGL